MTDLLIRQLPDDLHARLKEIAMANRRSVNQQIIILLEHSLAEEPSTPRPLPQPLRGSFLIDDEWLQHAHEEGRA